MGNSPEHYFKTQKDISKIIGEILNGDFIQSYIRYTINYVTDNVLPFQLILDPLCQGPTNIYYSSIDLLLIIVQVATWLTV